MELALELALRALDLTSNTILIPDLTFWATYEVVKLTCNRAIAIDIDKNYQIDFNLLCRGIEKYNPKAIIIVHLYGIIHSRINDIRKLCIQKNIYLIEDASHAFGSCYNNESIFKNSLISCISLYPTKVFGSCENSGIITTNSDYLNNKLRILCDHGRELTRYQHVEIGNNSVMSSISATYLEHKLINFDKVLYKMKTIYKIYSKFLCNLKLFKVNDISSSIQPNGYMFTLEYKLSNSINNKIKQLKKYGITVGNVYPETISDQKGFKKDDDKILNGSEKITKTVINLPQ